MIQCNKQMAQGGANAYLHSVIQNARFEQVFQEFPTKPRRQYLTKIMTHNKLTVAVHFFSARH
jgi:hypothetical protein